MLRHEIKAVGSLALEREVCFVTDVKTANSGGARRLLPTSTVRNTATGWLLGVSHSSADGVSTYDNRTLITVKVQSFLVASIKNIIGAFASDRSYGSISRFPCLYDKNLVEPWQ